MGDDNTSALSGEWVHVDRQTETTWITHGALKLAYVVSPSYIL